jgi:hypothetical protein
VLYGDTLTLTLANTQYAYTFVAGQRNTVFSAQGGTATLYVSETTGQVASGGGHAVVGGGRVEQAEPLAVGAQMFFASPLAGTVVKVSWEKTS